MRSKLFVPASRPELFAKALASEADALSFDLEDAVVEARKAEARENLRVFLQSDAALNSRKILIVRINAGDTIHFQPDLDAILQPRVDLLNVPKTGTAQDVIQVASAMEAVEARNKVSTPIRLLLNIETPQALRNAH